MKKYIVSYNERSDGSRCNGDYVHLIESEVAPTIELLRRNSLIVDGHCTNVSVQDVKIVKVHT